MPALPPEMLQFAGSLIAILALAWIARRLGLGPHPALADEAAVRAAIDAAYPGFLPIAIARDDDGHGAIARDDGGRILILRPHGSHFAGRLLLPGAKAHQENGTLVVDSSERRFGHVRLRLADASAWVQAIAANGGTHHA